MAATDMMWKASAVIALLSTLPVARGGVVQQRYAVPPGYYSPSYYPAPHGGWAPSWQESYAKAQALVGNMTLAEVS